MSLKYEALVPLSVLFFDIYYNKLFLISIVKSFTGNASLFYLVKNTFQSTVGLNDYERRSTGRFNLR